MKTRVDKTNKKLQKIIGFDMDGVILDNSLVKIQLAKKFGWEIKMHDTPSEIYKTVLPEPVFTRVQKLLYDDPVVSASVEVMPGVRDTLDFIISNKIPYFLISRRRLPESGIEALKRHGLWPEYFNEKNSFFVETPKSKNTKAKELGITHYIDDERGVLAQLTDVKHRFLFDHLNVFAPALYYLKVSSWNEIQNLILS